MLLAPYSYTIRNNVTYQSSKKSNSLLIIVQPDLFLTFVLLCSSTQSAMMLNFN